MNQPVFSLGANVNQNVTFSDSTNATDAFELATATAIMNVTNADATLTINSKVSSTNALATIQKTGLGELALLGGNSFGNTTTNIINVQDSAGTIAVAATGGLGVATTTFQFDGGALAFVNTTSATVAHIMTVDSNGGEIDDSSAGTVTLTAALDGSGPLKKGGTGELFLSSTTSTYNGTITVSSGNLRLTTPGALAYQSTSPATNATVDLVGSNSTLNIRDSSSANFNVNVIALGNEGQIYSTTLGSTTGQTITIGTIALGTTLNVNGSSGYILSAGTVTLAGTGTILASGDSFITTGIAQSSSPGALVKIGASSMTVTGSSSYSGGTTVEVGTLTDSAGGVPGAFGSGGINLTPSGTLSTQSSEVIANSNTTISPTAAVIVNDNQAALGTLVFNSAAPTIGSLSGTGNVDLNGASGTALTTSSTAGTTFSGVISDTGGSANNGSLTITGSGTFTLAGTSTYFGSTNVSGGTLNLTGALTNSALINVNNASTLVLAGTSDVPVNATLNVGTTANVLVDTNQTVSTLASSGTTNFTAGIGTIGTISGAGTVLVGSTAVLNVTGGFSQSAVVSNGTINLSGGAINIIGQGSGVGVGTGTTGLTTGGITGSGDLTVNGTANLYASAITQNVLTVGTASTVTIVDSAAPANTAATSVLNDISDAGTLDLNNNDLIVLDTTQYSIVKALIQSAYDGGAWDKTGITSSSARANAGAYGLGYAQGSTIGSTSFDGQTFTDAVLVKYTLLGDTQLRGTVGIGDYDTVLSNYGTAQDWSGGDFHYGGVVGIGDYDDVLSNYGAHASGNLAVGPSLARSISPAASIGPDLAKTDLKLEVNTTTGDVYVLATASAAFTGYTISDPSAHLLGGSTSPDPDKLLSVSASNGGNTNVYETSGNYVNWFKITETASQVAEGQQQNGFGTHSSRDDTINIPAGGTIDFGEIYNTASAQQDLTFDFAEAGTEPTNGPTYYGAEVDYITSTTPEPATLGLLGLGGLAMLRRRRRSAHALGSSH
jgi:autotransporter-associated beta strand protein